jgi:hypothetical protein
MLQTKAKNWSVYHSISLGAGSPMAQWVLSQCSKRFESLCSRNVGDKKEFHLEFQYLLSLLLSLLL